MSSFFIIDPEDRRSCTHLWRYQQWSTISIQKGTILSQMIWTLSSQIYIKRYYFTRFFMQYLYFSTINHYFSWFHNRYSTTLISKLGDCPGVATGVKKLYEIYIELNWCMIVVNKRSHVIEFFIITCVNRGIFFYWFIGTLLNWCNGFQLYPLQWLSYLRVHSVILPWQLHHIISIYLDNSECDS
jgi:hypothetical protein